MVNVEVDLESRFHLLSFGHYVDSGEPLLIHDTAELVVATILSREENQGLLFLPVDVFHQISSLDLREDGVPVFLTCVRV